MLLQKRFSDRELAQIVNEATRCLCACPAQVAAQLSSLRELFRYQGDCEQDDANERVVHQTIGMAAFEAHALLETCLDKVLTLEGWDRTSLTMPEGLRRRRAGSPDSSE